MDSRPLSADVDDRNARSWRVPNDPSPKHSMKPSTPDSSVPKPSLPRKSASKPSVPSSAASEASGDSHQESSRSNLRTRMWRFLFTNVVRAVDELYYFCEDENDVQKIQDAVHVLKRCLTDFEKLIERSDEQKRFEEGQLLGISWEVRKTSIGVRRAQIVEVEESEADLIVTTPGKDSMHKGNTAAITPAVADVQTPVVKSKFRATAKPFEPSKKVLAAIDTSLEGNKGSNLEKAMLKIESVIMDTSPTSATKPEMREVTLVTKQSASDQSSLTSSVAGLDEGNNSSKATDHLQNSETVTEKQKNSNLLVSKSAALAKTSNKPKKPPVGIVILSRGMGASPTAKLTNDTPTIIKNKNIGNSIKRTTPTAGRVRAISDSKISRKENIEEDCVVTEEMMQATNAVWAAAEAWIEAESMAEDNAWKQLELMKCSSVDRSFSEGFLSDEPEGLLSSHRITEDLNSSDLVFNDDADTVDTPELNRTPSAQIREELSVEIDRMKSGPNESDGKRYCTPPPSSMVDNRRPHNVSTSYQGTDENEGPRVDSSLLNSPTDSSVTFSSFGTSPSQRHATLHDKLSSPERRKLTPAEARQRLDERQHAAETNRSKSVSEIKEKAMAQNIRVKEVEIQRAERLSQAEQTYAGKLRDAEKRHDEYIKSIKGKAGNENAKVSEVIFINSFNEMVFKEELHARLSEVENRILAGRQRKEQLLQGLQDQRRKRNSRKAEQMSELRLNLERQKMERWEALQRRLESVQNRRQARLEVLQKGQVTIENAASGHDAKEDGQVVSRVTKALAESTEATSEAKLDEVTTDLDITDSVEATVHKQKKSKRGKNNKPLLDIPAGLESLDDNAVLELLTRANNEKNAIESEHSERMFQLLANNLSSDNLRRAPSSSFRERGPLLLAAVNFLILGELDPITFQRKNVTATSIREVKHGHVTFFADLKNCLDAALCTSHKKKRKKKNSIVSTAGESREIKTEAHLDISDEDKRHLSYTVSKSSILQWKSNTFTNELYEYIKRGLRITDLTGLSFSTYSTEIACTPDPGTLSQFIEMGGLLVCVLSLHKSTGALHDVSSLSLALNECGSKTADCSSNKKASLALLAAQGIEWCVRFDPINTRHYLKSCGLMECLVDMSSALLKALVCWNTETQEKHSAAEDNMARKSSKKNVHDHSARISSKGTSGSKHLSSKSGAIGSNFSAPAPDGGAKSSHPGYMCLLLPLLSSLNSLLQAATATAVTFASSSPSGADDPKVLDEAMLITEAIAYLLESDIFKSANEAMRCLDSYTDLNNGQSTIFHSIIYEIARLTLSIPKLVIELPSIMSATKTAIPESIVSDLVAYMQCEETSLASNIIQVLSALLLRDLGVIRHTANAGDIDDTPAGVARIKGVDKGTGLAGIGSGWDKNLSLPPPQILYASFKLLEALNAIAMVDVHIVQSIPHVLKLSLVHTSSFLLVILFQIIEDRKFWEQQQKDKKTSKRVNPKMRNLEKFSYGRPIGWCHDLVEPADATAGLCPLFIFLGYFCLNCIENQSIVACGTPPSLLLRLCRMPIRYLTDERLKHQILPTLISMCVGNATNFRVLHSELSPTLLTDYLSRLIEKERKGASGSCIVSTKSIITDSFNSATSFDPVADMKKRIPRELWDSFIDQLMSC